MFELRVESGSDQGRVFPLRGGVNSIGRGAANACPINDVSVSRSHCVITVEGGRATLQNKSRYGTFVAGNLIEAPFPLTTGQRIRLGYSLTELSFHATAESHGSIVEPPLDAAAVSLERSEAGPLLSRRPDANGAGGGGEFLKENSLDSGFMPTGGMERRKPAEPEELKKSIPRTPLPAEQKSVGTANEEEKESEFIVYQDAHTPKDATFEGSAFIPIEKQKELLDHLPPAEPQTRVANLQVVQDLRRMEIKKRRMRFMRIAAVLFGVCTVVAALMVWLF